MEKLAVRNSARETRGRLKELKQDVNQQQMCKPKKFDKGKTMGPWSNSNVKKV